MTDDCSQVIQGIKQRKKTFLAEPEWRDIPWSLKSDGKLPFDRLVDILLVDVPNSFAQCQALRDMVDPRQVLSKGIENICEDQRIEGCLDEWFDSFKTTVPGELYHMELSKIDTVVDNPEVGKLFPVAFHFPAFIVGQNLVYYWAALASVQAHQYFTHAILSQLVTMLESSGRGSFSCTCDNTTEGPAHCLQHFTVELLPSLNHRTEWPYVSAYKICQSVEYFLQDKMRGFAPASMLPSLAMVKGLWKRAPGCWDREIAWVDDMLARIRASGYGIAVTVDQELDLKA